MSLQVTFSEFQSPVLVGNTERVLPMNLAFEVEGLGVLASGSAADFNGLSVEIPSWALSRPVLLTLKRDIHIPVRTVAGSYSSPGCIAITAI